jgi:hypothetical protein
MVHDPEGFYQMHSYVCTSVCARQGMDAKLSRNLKTIQFSLNSNEPTMNRVKDAAEQHLLEQGWVVMSSLVISRVQ